MPDAADHPGRRIVATGVPIDCVNAPAPGSAPFGTELAPAALRDAGLPAAAGRRTPATWTSAWSAGTGTPRPGCWAGRRSWPPPGRLRSLVREQIDGRAVPFLVGGCCTLLPGALAGPGTPSARSGWPTWTATWTSTTARRH